eukprot:2302445-Prymnesium_polylepis.1
MIDSLFNKLDPDRSGKIEYAELDKIVRRTRDRRGSSRGSSSSSRLYAARVRKAWQRRGSGSSRMAVARAAGAVHALAAAAEGGPRPAAARHPRARERPRNAAAAAGFARGGRGITTVDRAPALPAHVVRVCARPAGQSQEDRLQAARVHVSRHVAL